MKTRARWFAATSLIAATTLMVAACQKSPTATDVASASSAADAPAAAPQSASADASAATQPLDYGIMGAPEISPEIRASTPQANLALFRHQELHPQQGTEDHPIEEGALLEISAKQRALFYAAAQGAPANITPQDWKWVRSEEDFLISSNCDDAQAQGNKPNYTQAQCADASSRANRPASASPP